MNIETLDFPPHIKIYRAKIDNPPSKNELVPWLEDHMEKNPTTTDAFLLERDWNPILNTLFDQLENLSKEVAFLNGDHLDLTISYWINRVKVKDPLQNSRDGDRIIYHSHKDINARRGIPIPNYTLVYYVQMPDNLEGKDGVLFFRDKEGREFDILPAEEECIFMKGDLEHVPNYAPNSSKDRIVIAGNIMINRPQKTKRTML